MAEKMVKVKALQNAVGSPDVKQGDTIEVNAENLKHLIEIGFVEELKAPKQAPKKPEDK
jgi:hypothetical protein